MYLSRACRGFLLLVNRCVRKVTQSFPALFFTVHLVGLFKSADMFAAACTDGTFRFFTRSGREEKKIKAHEGDKTAEKTN